MWTSGRTWLDVTANLNDPRGGETPPLLPQLLAEHGYTVFATGKWHNGQPSIHLAFPAAASRSSSAA